MTAALCPTCRATIVARARAAVDVLGDPAVTDTERAVAADVAAHALARLALASHARRER